MLLVLAAVAAVAAAAWFAIHDINPTPKVATATASVAIIAFIFNAYVTIRQNKIKFTLDVYFTRYTNSTYQEHSRIFYLYRDEIAGSATIEELGKKSPLKDATIETDLVATTIYMLNYWEAIATAYVEGHFDRSSFDNTSSSVAEMVVERTAPIIGEHRKADAAVLEYLTALAWMVCGEDLRKTIATKAGPPSLRLPYSEQVRWERLR